MDEEAVNDPDFMDKYMAPSYFLIFPGDGEKGVMV